MLKLSVSTSKKIGLPDYGSLGASCGVELELDPRLLDRDLAAFHDRVRQAYVACAEAVNDEFGRQQHGQSHRPSGGDTHSNGNTRNGHGNGNGHQATDKQLGYARQLAGQIEGLGLRRLDELCERMFRKSSVDLNSMDASGLIDTLKQIKAGDIDLAAALNGAAT